MVESSFDTKFRKSSSFIAFLPKVLVLTWEVGTEFMDHRTCIIQEANTQHSMIKKVVMPRAHNLVRAKEFGVTNTLTRPDRGSMQRLRYATMH